MSGTAIAACTQSELNMMPNISVYNPTELSARDMCWLDVHKADDTHGISGNIFWVKVANKYYSTTINYLRTHGTDKWLQQINSDVTIDNLNNQIESTEASIDKTMMMMFEDTTRIDELKAEVEDLKTELDLMTGLRDALKADNTELAIDLATEIKAHMDTKSNHAVKLAELTTAHNTAMSNLKTTHSDQISELTSLHEKELSDTIAEWSSKLATAQIDKQSAIEDMMSKHAAEIKSIQNDYADKVNELTAAHKAKVDELNAEITSLIASNNAKQATINGMVSKETYNSLSDQYQVKVDELAAANVEIFNLEQDLKVANDTIASKETMINSLNAVIDSKNSIISGLQTQANYWQTQYEEEKAAALVIQAQADHNEKMLNMFKDAYHNALEDIDALNAEITELEATISGLQSDITDLNSQITDLNSTIDAKNAKIESLNGSMAAQQVAYDALLNSSAAKTKKIKELEAEVIDLKQDKLAYWNYIQDIIMDAVTAKATEAYQNGNGMNDNSGKAIENHADVKASVTYAKSTVSASKHVIDPTQFIHINTAIENAVEAAYDTGYDDGYADGYADGFKDGVDSVSPY